MDYFEVAELAEDQDFAKRATGCYAYETASVRGMNPEIWYRDHAWKVAATVIAEAGVEESYAAAVAANSGKPGKDPTVITDAQIREGVLAMIAADSMA